jgi:hypothetical protein
VGRFERLADEIRRELSAFEKKPSSWLRSEICGMHRVIPVSLFATGNHPRRIEGEDMQEEIRQKSGRSGHRRWIASAITIPVAATLMLALAPSNAAAATAKDRCGPRQPDGVIMPNRCELESSPPKTSRPAMPAWTFVW